MIARALLVLSLAAPVALPAQAPQSCPWLNTGTAAKMLGSEVTASAHFASDWSGSCRFVTSMEPAASIEIRVGKTDIHPCGPGATPLTGIGNRAVLCSAHDTSSRNIQTISGRVRDVWFVVVLATTPENSHISPKREGPPESSSIEFLAEQIAGNLY